jgi:hypothetical protein
MHDEKFKKQPFTQPKKIIKGGETASTGIKKQWLHTEFSADS